MNTKSNYRINKKEDQTRDRRSNKRQEIKDERDDQTREKRSKMREKIKDEREDQS